ncbi:hypothetical protein [Streptomyces sp. G7(2002)]|uniref:hypothetical protein n=1 Tax=Streptomyces sp. G7(2002) TaxID=2971798 RepID=UPI00237E0528|nr:hypothetical protein [Streptomyces sp. G7(2002)]WDT58500.1 hypothetical protein NUT86_33210 [Streptomyces sp. G7(2002)]
MGRRDLPESDATGLSTDDLAGAKRNVDAQTPGPLTDAPPTFPGEADTIHRDLSAESEAGAPSQNPDENGPSEGSDEPLLGPEREDFRIKWQRIQGEFVDDPQKAVGAADQLVAEVMQALAAIFSDHKQGLESQWQQGEQVATEELRVALQRYRSFFNRLLKT